MAENNAVSFKIVLRDNKQEEVEPEVRRFNVDREVSTSLAYLQEKLVTVFPRLRRDHFVLTWTDSDGDVVSVASDEELIIALTEMTGPVYKLTAVVKENNNNSNSSNNNNEGEVHVGVSCDGCDQGIRGFRYKCAACPDFDLCGGCESKGLHPQHNMIRIATPQAVFPGHFFRRLNKMHERMSRRGGCGNKEEGQEEMDINDPFANLHPFGHHFRGGHWRGGPFGGPRGFRCGMGGGERRAAWEAMMAGRQQQECQKNEGEAAAAENKAENGGEGCSKKEEEGGCPRRGGAGFHCRRGAWGSERCQRKEKDEGAKQGATDGKDNAPPASAPSFGGIPLHELFAQLGAVTGAASGSGTTGADYLRTVGDFVAAVLDPLGVDVSINVETPNSNNKPKTDKDDDKDDKPKEDTEEKMEEGGEAEKTPSEAGSNNGEWTVIDKGEPSKNGNNQVYPELPREEPTVNVAAPAAAPAAAAPVEAPMHQVAVHPDPRIQVALQAMMNMGFSDDGGWLTSLLESKNGDISKTLDALQPAKH